MVGNDYMELLTFYTNHLEREVMPYWTKHCIDWENGGVNNILRDDGSVISTDKFMWSQGRALWTFSALFNDYNRDTEWLKVADNIARFIFRYYDNGQGGKAFKLHADGSTADVEYSIYVDAFIILGLCEYYRATGNSRAMDIASCIYSRTAQILEQGSDLPTKPHRIPDGMQSHGPFMIFAYVYHELGIIFGRGDILHHSLKLAEIIMTQHLDPDTLDFREFVIPGGAFSDSDAGKTFLPGHIIESMWFMERIYSYHKKPERVATAMKVIKKYIEAGWDREYGGIFLACHIDGGTPVWHMHDSKVWWPATEALYALLRAFEVTRDVEFLDWYRKVHRYAFDKYPDREYGEWHQNLDRRGNVIPCVVRELQVKDPFHLPRALIYSIATLRRLAGE